MGKKIRVMIVDDSILFRKALMDNLSRYPHIEIAGFAVDAFSALQKVKTIKPDVITTDVEMPGMTGIEFLGRLLPSQPIPVILVSSLNLNVFDALSAGAVDFVRKPNMANKNSVTDFFDDLSEKILAASKATVHIPSKRAMAAPAAPAPTYRLSSLKMNSMVIAIGASTGGTEAALNVLKRLPPDVPGIVMVQHMPEGFTKMYAERLNRICAINVKEAENGDKITRGHMLLAPGGHQMKLVKMGASYTVKCYRGDKVNGHMPSVDVLFDSVAENVKQNAIGIIMTGMGQDGAMGLLKMRQNGAYTIGQDKESCVVYGMPMVAQKIGAVTLQASCDNIASVLMKQLMKY